MLTQITIPSDIVADGAPVAYTKFYCGTLNVWVHLAITWNGKICFNISSVIDEQKYVGSNRLF